MDQKPAEISSSKMFGGYNRRFRHFSPTLGCAMTFTVYFPPSSSPSQKFPVATKAGIGYEPKESSFISLMSRTSYPSSHVSRVHETRKNVTKAWVPKSFIVDALGPKIWILYWLSGLTCTDENFIIKSGAQRAASSEGIALVAADTSPRGLNVEGEADNWDFGVGAGFYLNATEEKWRNWHMYDYIVKELPKVLAENFEQLDITRASISGHSMGGHGALTIYLKNLEKYKSVSAFAPIANPINCPWGQKAFSNYLGSIKSDWEEYDATSLVGKSTNISTTILIDQGENDNFLANQLLPTNFEAACKAANVPLVLRMQPGYDHSYFFISTFIDDHIHHHAQALKSS